MLVLGVFQRDLRLLFQGSELISVLEHKMHQTLHVDLNLDLMLLLKVLVLALLVS
jgi:hypothetical protein